MEGGRWGMEGGSDPPILEKHVFILGEVPVPEVLHVPGAAVTIFSEHKL